MKGIIEKIKKFFKRKAADKVAKPDQPAGEGKPEQQKEPAQAEKPKE